jgi:hypothetical protein
VLHLLALGEEWNVRSLILFAVTLTREDGEVWVFWEMGIGKGKFAKDENGAAVRLKLTGVLAIGAEAR